MRDPAICGGQPVVQGTRVTLRTVLATLAEGASVDEVVKAFPSLQPSDVRAVIAYAAHVPGSGTGAGPGPEPSIFKQHQFEKVEAAFASRLA